MTETPASSVSPAAPAAPAAAPVAAASPSTTTTSIPSTPSSPSTTPASPSPATAARPDWAPENFWDSSKGEVKGKEFRALFDENAAFRAAAESKRLSLPQAPDAYKADLPGDFKPPEGVTFTIDTNDPLLAQARTLAHESGLSQEQFSKFLSIYAGTQVATQERVNAARNAEVAKLGANGPARVNALDTFFKSYLGNAEGAQLMSRAFTASDVQILEKLVSKVTTQGGASFNGNGREPPERQGVASPEQIRAMTPAQRLDYSRRFDQKSMPEWQDPRGAAA